MRRAAARLGALVLLLAGAAPEPGRAQPDHPAPGIEAALRLQREDGTATRSFARGEPVVLVLTLRNPGSATWRGPMGSGRIPSPAAPSGSTSMPSSARG